MMSIRVLQAKRTMISTGLEYESVKPDASDDINEKGVADRSENNS